MKIKINLKVKIVDEYALGEVEGRGVFFLGGGMGCTHQSGGINNAFDDNSLRKKNSRLRTKEI